MKEFKMTKLKCIKDFILSDLIYENDVQAIQLNGNLLDEGIIDSLAIMKLVLFIEQTFAIEIHDEEIIPENFQSLDCMVTFINQKSVGA
jgi:acyl carrier protein